MSLATVDAIHRPASRYTTVRTGHFLGSGLGVMLLGFVAATLAPEPLAAQPAFFPARASIPMIVLAYAPRGLDLPQPRHAASGYPAVVTG